MVRKEPLHLDQKHVRVLEGGVDSFDEPGELALVGDIQKGDLDFALERQVLVGAVVDSVDESVHLSGEFAA